jgi:hypothetical protein
MQLGPCGKRPKRNGWFKVLIICVAIMAAAGFFQGNVIVFGALFWPFGCLDQPTFELVLKLSYLLLAPTMIGTGLIIWLDSLAQAWRQRDFVSVAAATWNTYAMYHNVSDAASNLPRSLLSRRYLSSLNQNAGA